MLDTLTFLAQVVVISLSGVMAPGAITAATLAAGTRRRHAGAMIAVGHGIVELPLIVGIILGVGPLLQRDGVRVAIGLAGGAIMLWMAVGMVRALRAAPVEAASAPQRRPIWTGIVLTAGNPFFLVWWATVGLNLSLHAVELGVMAFALFAAVHWLCDLIWLEILTLASHSGTRALGPILQKVILVVCGSAMAVFGVLFLVKAVGVLIAPA
ncbi:MAG: LysE family transporter [Planctomycetota bacterium]